MTNSPYARDLHTILAALHTPGGEQDDALPEEEAIDETIHVYPVEGGGILFTKTLLEEEAEPDSSIVDSQPHAVRHRTNRAGLPVWLVVALVFLLMLLLDSADTTLVALLTPTATITLLPDVRSIRVRSSATLGTLLAPITLSESQTVPTTGHGHQNARAATGTLTFYNGLSTVQSLLAGTVIVGQDGTRVATDAAVTIAPANPPSLGAASIMAQAVKTGAAGNIPAGEINTALSTGVYVKNLAPFTGGQDARDFQIVTRQDQDSTAALLQQKVTASMNAALQEQLLPGQALQTIPCSPTTTTDPAVGAEATQVRITVAESCTAIAYNNQELTNRATRLLLTQATRTLGPGYMLVGNVQVTLTQATAHPTSSAVSLFFTGQSTWVYTLTNRMQQQIKALVAGKPRLTALRLLARLPGLHQVSISGIPDNQLLPDDLTHLHVLLVVTVF
jgi:hypothetical protein